ncbi:MAG: hypothetical protein M0P55_14545 [Clostridiales bacterium]|nr:hypothetical protein [Clostridiales bacterium]
MTNLDKLIRRRTMRPMDNTGRRLVVILEPGDIIGIREERRRAVYRAPLSMVFWMLAKWDAAERARKRAEERKARRAAR